jgi:hypothetical protein
VMDEPARLTTMLDALAEMYAQRDVVNLDKQAALDATFTAELKAQIAAIELEFAGRTEALDANIGELESAVKDGIKAFGASIKGERLHAVYMSPRASWDTRRLDGYAAAHPEINQFRSAGEPSASIRRVNQK